MNHNRNRRGITRSSRQRGGMLNNAGRGGEIETGGSVGKKQTDSSGGERQTDGSGVYAQASFTVEAALLMGMILPVLIAVLVMGFYLHDSAYLQGTVTELCARGSCLRLYSDRQEKLFAIRSGRLSRSLLWTKGASGSVSAGEDEVSAQAAGSFPVPGLAARLLGKSSLAVKAKWSRKLYKPTDLIWKIRAAKYLLDEFV